MNSPEFSPPGYVTEIGYPSDATEVLHKLHRPMPEPEPLPEPELEPEVG